MKTFEEDLQRAVAYHGHICSGQVLGVRLARLGLNLMGITEPEKYRDLIVYVEADRCIADAVGTISGCNLGRRRLKWLDFGKMAATFYDINGGKAVRLALNGAVGHPEAGDDLVEYWNRYKDEEIFKIQHVRLNVPKEDLPGLPLEIVSCYICGEKIFDKRQVITSEGVVCRNCHGKSYYETLD
jgi:formylmethanofuran dehydrogenase subunit E